MIFKSFRIECNRFGFEPEIVAKLAKKSAKIVDMPISYIPRSSEEGKKIGFSDGLAAVWFIFKYSLFG